MSVYGHGITGSKHEIDSNDVANMEASRKRLIEDEPGFQSSMLSSKNF